MNNRTVATPVVDKNNVLTNRNKRVEPKHTAQNRAHNIKVPQAAKNADEATQQVNEALALAQAAIERREMMLPRIIAAANGNGQLDTSDPELIEIVRVSAVANEIRDSIERLRNLKVSDRAVQSYIGTAVGGSLDGVEFSSSDEPEVRVEKKALRAFYMAAFLALQGERLEAESGKD